LFPCSLIQQFPKFARRVAGPGNVLPPQLGIAFGHLDICVAYLHAIEEFSRYFHRSPDRLGPDHIRQYQAYLFRERKLQAGTIAYCTAALRFLYVKTLRRPYLPEHIPFTKRPRQLPVILSPTEVQRVIDSAENLMRRAMAMTLYSTGIRCSELCHLKVSDIDSERMVIRIHKGKSGRDRDVLLCPKLLETLREYWRWMKPKTYLFPGTVNNWRADKPITPKVVWKAVNEAGKRAGINKRVAPHLLRHSFATHTPPIDRFRQRICLPSSAYCNMEGFALCPNANKGWAASRPRKMPAGKYRRFTQQSGKRTVFPY
jgi:site-specific recombinase XerD